MTTSVISLTPTPPAFLSAAYTGAVALSRSAEHADSKSARERVNVVFFFARLFCSSLSSES